MAGRPRSVNRSSWLGASWFLQVLLAAYFQAILWFPLGRWNDQPGMRLIEAARQGHAVAALGFTVVMLLPLAIFALALLRGWRWLMWLGLAGYGAWAVLQVQSWWIPWLFGADARALHNQRFLQRTLKIFPASIRHPAPDAMHFVLDVILFAVVVTTAVGLLRTRSAGTR